MICLIFANLCSLLIYPIIISYNIRSHPLSASYLMISSTCILLKLISFHHVKNDNRSMLKKMVAKGTTDPFDNQSGLPNDVYREMLKYPSNLEVKRFFRYMCAPTCCYQLLYPTATSIRKSFLLKRFLEFLFCNIFIV